MLKSSVVVGWCELELSSELISYANKVPGKLYHGVVRGILSLINNNLLAYHAIDL
jgi:hypothetical protein